MNRAATPLSRSGNLTPMACSSINPYCTVLLLNYSFLRRIFVVSTTEPVWSKAHKIMLPLFSTQAMHAYLPKMWETTMPMILKWERLNPDDEIDVYDDMVRLTSDIIGSCCLDYNFQSFYRETPHPLIQALMRSIEGALFLLTDNGPLSGGHEGLDEGKRRLTVKL